MAKSGEVINNSVTKERIVFRKTAQDTNGTLLQFDDILQAGGLGPPEHVHLLQEERFEVISGTMGIRIEGREQLLQAGEHVVVPLGVAHTYWNAGDDELHQITEFRPALQMETFFETLFGLARDGKLNKQGDMNLLQISVIVIAYQQYVTKPPIPLQKALCAVLRPIARLLGYRASYPQYSTSAAHPTMPVPSSRV